MQSEKRKAGRDTQRVVGKPKARDSKLKLMLRGRNAEDNFVDKGGTNTRDGQTQAERPREADMRPLPVWDQASWQWGSGKRGASVGQELGKDGLVRKNTKEAVSRVCLRGRGVWEEGRGQSRWVGWEGQRALS